LTNGCPAANIVERMCQGWDFVWIDAQHGQHSYDSVLQAVRAAAVIGVDALVRVPGHEYGVLGPFADLASSAIMVPMVEDAAQAASVTRALRFPPTGNRSYGGRRMIDLYGRTYHHERELLVIAQIETLESVDNAASIIATDGIDMLFFSPDDMKVRLGIDVDTPIRQNELLMDGMKRVAAAAVDAGKFVGCVAGSPDILVAALDMGYRLFGCGSDIGFIRTSAAARLEETRAALAGKGYGPTAADGSTRL
jgi:4-hydroxy-2-oxoheptanedioate aldolase